VELVLELPRPKSNQAPSLKPQQANKQSKLNGSTTALDLEPSAMIECH
jgi:hypothetical protein